MLALTGPSARLHCRQTQALDPVPLRLLLLSLAPIPGEEAADTAQDAALEPHVCEKQPAPQVEVSAAADATAAALLSAAETSFDSDISVDLENDAADWPSTDI